MNDMSAEARRTTQLYQDYFEMAFETADIFSFWWQPVFKGFGRTHLELANLQSRNAQAFMTWGRTIASAPFPGAVISANMDLVRALTGHYNEALPRVSGALTKAAEPVTAFELLPLPLKRTHDSLIIPDRDQQDMQSTHRRVA